MNRLSSIFSFVLLTAFILSLTLSGCDQNETNKTKVELIKTNVDKKSINVYLAPFDTFPTSPFFPLVFRFSKPVAPFDSQNNNNFSKIKVSPNKPGNWRWINDSELSFTPNIEWLPLEKISIDLSELVIDQEYLDALSQKVFNIDLPQPQIKLVSCEYEIKNKSPLIQSPKAVFYSNYPVKDLKYTDYVKSSWQKNETLSNLDRSISLENNSFLLKIEGAKLFRPRSDGKIKFEVKEGLKVIGNVLLNHGASCELPYKAEVWDKQQIELVNEKKEKPSVNLEIYQAPTVDLHSPNYRSSLKITFNNTSNSSKVPHQKPKGIIINDAFEITPKINGTWKTDESDQNVITFSPKEDWAVGQKYTISIKKDNFPDLDLKVNLADFVSPSIRGEIYDYSLYTDPIEPLKRKIISSLKFSHSVDLDQVKKYIGVKIRVEPEKNFISKNVLNFNLLADAKDPKIFHLSSDNITLPDEPGEARIEVGSGIVSSKGGLGLENSLFVNISIPSVKNIFRVANTNFTIVKKESGILQRILAVELTEPIKDDLLVSNLETFLLPDCREKINKQICKDQSNFHDQGAVFHETLLKSEKISLHKIEKAEGQSPLIHFFDIDVPGGREVFLRIKKDFTSLTNFSLSHDYRNVLFVEDFPKELKIMHDGSLLSLTGSKKLGIRARNIEQVEFELARIPSSNVHHLVSVTYGDFSKPNFNYGSFALNQLSEKFKYLESFPEMLGGETNTATVDFSKFTNNSSVPRGLFLLTIRENLKNQPSSTADSEYINYYPVECDPSSDEYCYSEDYGYQPIVDRRLVLLTDLGLIVKNSLKNENDLFVVSFKTGLPVSGANVKLLSQNGVPLITKTTNSEGRATFYSSEEFKNEKTPLMFIAEKDGDFSYLPYAKEERRMNISRFEVSGVTNNQEADGLRSLIFSDRGIYRPGEKVSFGIIVRKRNLELAGAVPLDISISDPRGVEVYSSKISLSKFGFEDFYWSTDGALTGTYNISVNLIKSNNESEKIKIGGTTFRVEEFQPDKLNSTVRYVSNNLDNEDKINNDNQSIAGEWQKLDGDFQVEVKNLFGTPANKNKVQGKIQIKPWDGIISTFKDFSFYLKSKDHNLPLEPESLGEIETNDQGLALFKPSFNKYQERAFSVDFVSEAFEKDSGRSVISSTSVLLSNEPYFLGYKADGSLSYISKGQKRKISFLVVDSSRKIKPDLNLKLELTQIKMISALVKKPNGSFGYEMTPKKETIKQDSIKSEQKESEIELETQNSGKFILSIYSESGTLLNELEYQVHGEGDSNFMTDKTSELGLALNKQIVGPGEELEISINSPFSGAGLITIERDKVYYSEWFTLQGLSSTKKIKAPDNIVGNAYVSVMLIRSLDSKDIFSSPLSYAVKPFTISKSHYSADITLHAPTQALPGQNLDLSYQLSKPGRLLVYAVDEGILQFARYKNPDPLSQFIPKRALEVGTFQILDQLLPEYRIVESLSSPGGDEDVGLGKFKNPFGRKKRPPMTFWSGVINEEKLSGSIKIPIPEYYNGTLRMIAVLVTDRQVGTGSVNTLVRDNYIIEPQAPLSVSPGDEFEIGATIAHGGENLGKTNNLDIDISASEGLEILDKKKVNLSLKDGSDTSIRFKARSKDKLGSANFSFELRDSTNKNARVYTAEESISIRPASVIRTEIRAGSSKGLESNKKELNIERTLFEEQREVTASISSSPITLAKSFITYLKNYPYGCTEQLVSLAFPGVIIGSLKDIELSDDLVSKFQTSAFNALSSRQRFQGDFGLWDIQSESDLLFSVYAMHFLLESRDKGANIPASIFERGLEFIKTVSISEYCTMYEQLAQSYALYLRARNSEIVSSEVSQLVSQLNRQWGDQWNNTAISLFLAATYKIMKMDTEADKLFVPLPEVWKAVGEWPINSASFFGAVHAWLSSKHFDQSKWPNLDDVLTPYTEIIEGKKYNTFESVFSILAIDSLSERASKNSSNSLSISAELDNSTKQALSLKGDRVLSAQILSNIKKLTFGGIPRETFYYELSETGYDIDSQKTYSQGLSIKREIKNVKGEITSQFSINEPLDVTLFIEAERDLSRMAIVDLLPGGVEIDLSQESITQRESLYKDQNTWKPNAIDIQEDRLIFYGNLSKGTNTFTFRLKPLSAGTYTYPGAFAEAMYDLNTKFLGEKQKIVISK